MYVHICAVLLLESACIYWRCVVTKIRGYMGVVLSPNMFIYGHCLVIKYYMDILAMFIHEICEYMGVVWLPNMFKYVHMLTLFSRQILYGYIDVV